MSDYRFGCVAPSSTAKAVMADVCSRSSVLSFVKFSVPRNNP